MERKDARFNLERLESTINYFKVEYPAYELNDIIDKVIEIANSADITDDKKTFINREISLLKQIKREEVEMFDKAKLGKGRQTRLNDVKKALRPILNIIRNQI